MTMLSDDEIYAMYNEPRSDAEMLEFARELITAHTAKLLANVEMPRPDRNAWPNGFHDLYTEYQLQQYAAAAAEQARMKALYEAKRAVDYAGGDNADYHMDAIEQLKRKV